MTELDGRVVLVTGSSRGIGAAIARLFAERGALVVVHGRDADAVRTVVAGIKATGGHALAAIADLTRYDQIEAMRDSIEQDLGPIDILVANAGGSTVRPGPLEDIGEADWRGSVDANLTATFLTLKAFLPGMKQRHHGTIITMSSAAARRPTPSPPWPTPPPKPVSRCSLRSWPPKRDPTASGSTALPPKRSSPSATNSKYPKRSKNSYATAIRSSASAHPTTSPTLPCSWPPITPRGSAAPRWTSPEALSLSEQPTPHSEVSETNSTMRTEKSIRDRPPRLRRQARLIRLVNPLMRRVLALPFSTPPSKRLMLVYLTGRRSGRSY